MSREVELGCENWTSFSSSCSSTAVQRTLSLWLCPSTAVETAVAQCTSRWAMARGHRLNTSIVLAAVHGLSGLFRAVSAVEPSLFHPLSHSVPIPNKPSRFRGCKATLKKNAGWGLLFFRWYQQHFEFQMAHVAMEGRSNVVLNMHAWLQILLPTRFLAYCTRPVTECAFGGGMCRLLVRQFFSLFAQFKTTTKSHENYVFLYQFSNMAISPQNNEKNNNCILYR